MDEINSLVDRFNEIDRQFSQVKKTKDYQCWVNKPIEEGRRSESREFELTLWKGTNKEEKFRQSVEKGTLEYQRRIPKNFQKVLNSKEFKTARKQW